MPGQKTVMDKKKKKHHHHKLIKIVNHILFIYRGNYLENHSVCQYLQIFLWTLYIHIILDWNCHLCTDEIQMIEDGYVSMFSVHLFTKLPVSISIIIQVEKYNTPILLSNAVYRHVISLFLYWIFSRLFQNPLPVIAELVVTMTSSFIH